MAKTCCPHCRLLLTQTGRFVVGIDDTQQPFVFTICARCTERLDKLPDSVQRRHLTAAISQLARHPERYPEVKFFESFAQASLYAHLMAERMSSTIH